jgi:hypothetical protein
LQFVRHALRVYSYIFEAILSLALAGLNAVAGRFLLTLFALVVMIIITQGFFFSGRRFAPAFLGSIPIDAPPPYARSGRR